VCLLYYFCSNADSCSHAPSAEAFDCLRPDGYIVVVIVVVVEHIHAAPRDSPGFDDRTSTTTITVEDREGVACPSATDCLAILDHQLLTSGRAAARAC